MQVKRLTLKDKLIFEKYLSLEKHYLSAYAFSNIFIWGCMYDIFWAVIKSNLCVFFKDRVGCFLYLPPLGSRFEAGALNSSFEIMDKFNNNPIISRIENVEEDAEVRYKDLGYKAVLAGCDYLCRRQSLASLKGSPFKKKRASVNHFVSS